MLFASDGAAGDNYPNQIRIQMRTGKHVFVSVFEFRQKVDYRQINIKQKPTRSKDNGKCKAMY